MPVRISHVQTSIAVSTGPAPPAPKPDPLEVETGFTALRHALWLSLYLSQQLRLADVQCQISRLLRDIDRRRDELGIA